MATATVVRNIEYGLRLNEEEHKYLLEVLQNDLTGNESVEQSKIRESIWKVLKNVEVRV